MIACCPGKNLPLDVDPVVTGDGYRGERMSRHGHHYHAKPFYSAIDLFLFTTRRGDPK